MIGNGVTPMASVVSLPYSLIANTRARASQVMANFNALVNVLVGGQGRIVPAEVFFGDGDTGFYEFSDDDLRLLVSGTEVARFYSGGLVLAAALPVASGGTGQTTYTNGQLLIGNTTGNTLTKAALTGTANQVVVTNGTGSITLSLPQSIAAASTPTFASLTLTSLLSVPQIAFPAAQSASADPNTFDDYEEGTWTPVLSSAVNLTGTSITGTSRYTKSGNVVIAKFTISATVTNNTTLTAIEFTLPYNCPYFSDGMTFGGCSVWASGAATGIIGTVDLVKLTPGSSGIVSFSSASGLSSGPRVFYVDINYLTAT